MSEKKLLRSSYAHTGFTLMELMLVVIIIGVLVAMAAPRLTGRVAQARVTTAASDIATLGLAIDLFVFDTGRYPELLQDLIHEPVTTFGWCGPYLKKMPRDPWGREYVYNYPAEEGIDYDLFSCGVDGAGGGDDDITSW